MKKAISISVSFLLGLCIGAGLMSFLASPSRPKVLSVAWWSLLDDEGRKRGMELAGTDTGFEWLDGAQVWDVGNYYLVTPQDRANASLQVWPKGRSVGTLFSNDSNHDGQPDSLWAVVNSGHGVMMDDQNFDGHFDGFVFSTGEPPDGEAWFDTGLDGVYDTHFAPGPVMYAHAREDWYEVLKDGDSLCIQYSGEARPIRLVLGKWVLENAAKQEMSMRPRAALQPLAPPDG